VASKTADGSGNFTFSSGDYSGTLTDGTHANMTVRGVNGDGTETANSAGQTVYVDTTVAPTPAGFALGTVTSSAVQLTWTVSTDSDGTNGYLVERAPDSGGSPGSFTELSSGGCSGLALSATSCTDSSLTANTKYWYRMRAYDTNSVQPYILVIPQTYRPAR